MSSTSHNRLREVDSSPIGSEIADAVDAAANDTNSLQQDSGISHHEAELLRAEKLEAIRKAINAGAYDSDELLDKALNRMLESIDDEPQA
jgi:anti-sigma28 factor (negative regulator of flagellin synthesis)